MQASLNQVDFGVYCETRLAPLGHKPAEHHKLMIAALQDLADNPETDRLLEELPPGAGKSIYTSELFPAWYMGRKRGVQIIGASAVTTLAERFSRKAQSHVREMSEIMGFGLRTEKVTDWSATNDGEYFAVGIGGSAGGRRANLIIIDDPFSDSDEADKVSNRDAVWSWYQSVVERRLKPGGKIAIVTTRWHKDDLAGRCLLTEPKHWKRLRLRAQALPGEVDPVGREPGEFLWPEPNGEVIPYAKKLERDKESLFAACKKRIWYALFQQEPIPSEGGMFDTTKILEIGPLLTPASTRRTTRAWDFGATAEGGARDPDYTVGLRLTESGKQFVVEDIVRGRWSTTDVDRMVLETAQRDGKGVTIVIPQDPGAAGKARFESQVHMLAGFTVRKGATTGKKEVRAAPFSSQVGAGNVAVMLGAMWVKPFIEEMNDFPYGDHDDQIDAAADAFNALLEKPVRKTEQRTIQWSNR